MTTTSANRLELLQIADSVAREKSIERAQVLEAMEESLAKAARSRYGIEFDIRAHIHPKTGALTMTRHRQVVEEVENRFTEMDLTAARTIQADIEIGEEVVDNLPALDFGRVAAQSAKQVILQKVREAERERQYEEYKDRIGTIVNGQVARVEYGNVIVNLGANHGEAFLGRDHLINRESMRPNDHVRALIMDVRPENRGSQIFLSRTDNRFLVELYKSEVPEIYDGTIEIVAVARDPGSRAKIGVISHDSSLDPVGACVGMRGSRVQAVVNELQGEKIDIIPWTEDQTSFLVSALQPAEVTKVILDEDTGDIVVVVPDESQKLAIGRRGQNIRLAVKLTGLQIKIISETQEAEKRQKETALRSSFFMKYLGVDEMVAHLLVAEGFSTLEEIAYVELDEIASIAGFNAGVADDLQTRARTFLENRNEEARAKVKAAGMTQDLIDFEGLSPVMLLKLAEDGILTLEEFAKCADWELAGGYTEINGARVREKGLFEVFNVDLSEAQDLIMRARFETGIVSPDDILQDADEALEDEEPEEKA